MHSCQDIEENRYFSNGGTNLHVHAIAQGRPEDNQVEFLQGPHGIVNPPKNLVLNNIRRFTQMANGLKGETCNSTHPLSIYPPPYVLAFVITRIRACACTRSLLLSFYKTIY